ncbi:pyrroline-5-carboxylate reductase [Moraxella osloensis]|nr:pyrroline-5-carboxylate reductase [Moraxella osloensis]MBW4010102.1 pyrroline-5-carboxylate reductase [Moraxella osloensis]
MATTTSLNIAFIGGGNMASALIAGLLAKGQPTSLLHVVETDAEKLADFHAQGLNTYNASNIDDTKHAIEKSDVVVLAVKPQVIKDVLLPVKDSWGEQVVISIAAGIATDSLAQWLGPQVKLVRAMPNTPAMIQMGATGLYATDGVSEAEQQLAQQVMSAAGLVLWVNDEDLLHAVTAISGSAPAYFFYMLENMIATGEKLGLTQTQATALAMQTALGSAQMALTSHDTPAELRRKVTSPNGTTQAAIEVMDDKKMHQIIADAMLACEQRSRELSQAFGK